MTAPVPDPDNGDLELEQTIIGAAMLNNRDFEPMSAIVGHECFAEPIHGHIWRAIAALIGAGRKAVPVALEQGFGKPDPLAELGGTRAYLSRCIEMAMGLPRNPVGLAEVLRDMHVRRSIVATSKDVQASVAGGASVADAMAQVERLVAEARAAQAPGRIPTLGEVARDLLARAAEPGLPTGWAPLDALLNGMEPQQLIVVAGRPGMGKSLFAGGLARNIAESGRAVLVFSLEMSRLQWSARMLCDLAHRADHTPITYRQVITKDLTDFEQQRLALAARQMEALPIEVQDEGARSLNAIRAASAAWARKCAAAGVPIGAVIVDHIHLVQATEHYRGNRTAEITEISGALKACAKALEAPVIALAQLNREVEHRERKDRRPQLSDLRESGSIEQDADVVIGLYRPGYYVWQKRPEKGASIADEADWRAKWNEVKHDLQAIVLKQRNGEQGTADLWVDIRSGAIRGGDHGA